MGLFRHRVVTSHDILNGAITPTLWLFTTPLVFSFMITIVYSWIDTYFVSHLGVAAIAAIGISEQCYFFIYTAASGFTIGTGVIIARRIGEGNEHEAETVALQGLTGIIVIASAIMVSMQILLPLILPLLGVRGGTLEYVLEYLPMLLAGLPCSNLIYQMNVTARSVGNSGFAFWTLLSFTMLNFVLAPLLIFGVKIGTRQVTPSLGMIGAGMATALANVGAALLGMMMLTRGATRFHISWRLPIPQVQVMRAILGIGVPSSLQYLAVGASRAMLMMIHNAFGTTAAAAYTLGLRLDFFVFMPIFAIGVAIETFTGHCLGARKVRRIFDFYRTATVQMIGVVLMLGLGVFVGGEYFAALFTRDAEVLSQSVAYMRVSVVSYPCFVALIMALRVMSGAGDAMRSMMIMVIVLFALQLPSIIVLAWYCYLGIYGVWYGIVAGYAFGAILAYYHLLRKKWLAADV
ncbi:MAG: MATE family efflux transporter [Bacteroidota bacterium]|nr:MATE family efflux transporter [Candidatus Kapabacteria bacterium]MDW8219916.1 MATE family efflux transporter [Bacteroidota bacterium]